MSLTILYDDKSVNDKLLPGHGFSCLIDLDGTKVLFDTGGDSPKLLYNMGVLGINPRSIDVVVISHNHWDHVSGLSAILSINPHLAVYLPTYTKKPIEVYPGIWITGYVEAMYRDQKIVEQALAIDAGGSIVIVTGCCHPGIETFVETVKDMFKNKNVKALVGGWHLIDKKPREVVEALKKLKELGIVTYIPCHCIGDKNLEVAEKILGGKLIRCGVGLKVAISMLL